ncbi:MAG: FG-GAP repeat protein [Planctomycetaceae bacterium]|nr:FG-GAP repeat protein [Planctomycetaceae bacterium]
MTASIPSRWLKSLLGARRSRRKPRFHRVEQLEIRTLLTAPNPLHLSQLDGTNGVRINGESKKQYLGQSMAFVGDVNGDGYDDVLLGAPGDPILRNAQAYLLYGNDEGFGASLDLASLTSSQGVAISAAPYNNRLGYSVAGVGDVNGDGLDDFALGMDSESLQQGYNAVYVIFGSTSGYGASINVRELNGANGFEITAPAEDRYFGASVTGLGDVNGDGIDDIGIGNASGGTNSKGEAIVVFGKSNGFLPTFSASELNGTNGFRISGDQQKNYFGTQITGVGDLNGDGFADIAVSSFREVSVLFGGSEFDANIDTSSFGGTNGFEIDASQSSDIPVIAYAGDLNDDGFNDLILGLPNAKRPGSNYNSVGTVYTLFGHSTNFPAVISASSIQGADGFQFHGKLERAYLGYVGASGDVNGDGINDLLVGSTGTSEVDVLFGTADGFEAPYEPGDLDGTNGFRIAGGSIGRVFASGGDFNGDGFDDILAANPFATPGYQSAGSVYLIWGGNFTAEELTQLGDANNNQLAANHPAAKDILIGTLGADALISDGGGDVLRAGPGDDVITLAEANFSSVGRVLGGAGNDALHFSGSGIHLDLTLTPDNRLQDVEFIDISGSGANSLILDVQEVLNLSHLSNTLTVYGNADDVIGIGSGWTQVADEQIGIETYRVYTHGSAVLKVHEAIGNATLTIEFEAANVPENGQVTGLVRRNSGLNEPLDIFLSSSDEAFLGVPVRLTIPVGQPSVAFSADAFSDAPLVAGDHPVTVTAESPGFEMGEASIDVTDIDIPFLTFTTSGTLRENNSILGTITRNAGLDAPLVVMLSSSDVSELTVPLAVTIPRGSTVRNFEIKGVIDDLADGIQNVEVTASAVGYASVSTQRAVNDIDRATLTLAIDQQTVSEGESVTLTLSRNTPVEEASVVAVSVRPFDVSTEELSFPSFVTIPAGESSTSFVVAANMDARYEGTQEFEVSASLNGFISASTQLRVTDVEPIRLTIMYGGGLLTEGQVSYVWISRDGDLSLPLPLHVQVDVPDELYFPSEIVIPASSRGAGFAARAFANNRVEGQRSVIMTVSADGYDSAERIFTIQDASTPEVELNTIDNPGRQISESGQTATFSMRLTTPASSEVSIRILPDARLDLGLGPGQALTLIYSADTTSPQRFTVAAVNDETQNVSSTAKIDFDIVSNSLPYDALQLPPVTFSIEDNDPQDDVIAWDAQTKSWHVGRSNGLQFSSEFGPAWTTDVAQTLTGDFDGDGKLDLASFNSDGSWTVAPSRQQLIPEQWGIGFQARRPTGRR